MTHILEYLVQDWDANRAINIFNKIGVPLRITACGESGFIVAPSGSIFLTTAEAVLDRKKPIWHGGTMGSSPVDTPEEGIKELKDYFMQTASTNKCLAVQTESDGCMTRYRLFKSDGRDSALDLGSFITERVLDDRNRVVEMVAKAELKI